MFYISMTVTLSYLFVISKDSSCGEVKLLEDTGMLPLKIEINFMVLRATAHVSSDT